MELNKSISIVLFVCFIASSYTTYYYYSEYMRISYPSGSMGANLFDIEVVPDPWGYRDFDYIVIRYTGGKIVFGETNIPLDKIRNLNYTPYVVHKNNKTYVYQKSWVWEWHTVDRLEPGTDAWYSRVKVLDKLYCGGYGWNKYDGFLNRTEALERFGW